MVGYIIAAIIVLISWICGVTNTINQTIFNGGYNQLQIDTARKYKQFKVKKIKPTFAEFCYPKSYSIQRQQAFAGEYMKPGSGHDSLLVFHKIGAGKTCLSIQIAEKWKSRGKPLIVLPASLIPSFRAELRSPCAGSLYMTEEERAKLKDEKPGSEKYKEIISRCDKRIDLVYTIMSYNKLATDMKDGATIRASIIIIDEVQNVTNQQGVFFKSILECIDTSYKVPVVVMSGTPIFDNPQELSAIAQLMRIDVTPNSIISIDTIPKLFADKVSFYAGAPGYTYPTVYIKVKKCVMSKHQARWYKSEVETEMNKHGALSQHAVTNDFYIKSRQRSNIVPPNGLTGAAGIRAMTPALIKSALSVYSCKYAQMMKKLKRGQLSFIYSSFTGLGGISVIVRVLTAFGYSNFATEGPGKKRFAIFSGEETGREKDLLRATFNSPDNDDAGLIQIVIGSPAIKEGVSLLRVRQCHIMELYWNFSRLEQIWGRVNRYCSHKSLAKIDRDVTIYLYAAVVDSKSNTDPANSVDLYMLKLAEEKRDASEPYIRALMDIAIDKKLNMYK